MRFKKSVKKLELETLRYPIGIFNMPKRITLETIGRWIDEIEHLPDQLRMAVKGLNKQQLDTPYRPGGWTIRQVIHHLPDSHMNSYIRFRWALTEDKPKIKAYHEDLWAELDDAKNGNPEISIILLEALHIRWSMLLRSLTLEQLHKTFIHPDSRKEIRLDENIGNYAWHGKHHLAHINNCIQEIKLKENG
jgi:hypothetical protein